MMKSGKNILNNQRGGVVLVTIVIISVVLVILSGVASFKLTEVSRQAFRVNESFRYLNVMEEMALHIARARQLGKAVQSGGMSACPASTTSFDITSPAPTKKFCLPNDGAITVDQINEICIHHTDGFGQTNDFCLSNMTTVTSIGEPGGDGSAVATLNFRIVPKHKPSLFQRAVNTFMSMGAANAACGDWDDDGSGCGAPGPGTSYSPPPQNITPPPAYTTAPVAAGTEATGGALGLRANMDGWTPDASWSATNEIMVPDCTTANQSWLGCMRCDDTNVTCIDLAMCPPATPGCTQPYRQRIVVY